MRMKNGASMNERCTRPMRIRDSQGPKLMMKNGASVNERLPSPFVHLEPGMVDSLIDHILLHLVFEYTTGNEYDDARDGDEV